MVETIVTIIVAVIASGIFTGLGSSIYKSFKEKNHKSDNAWDQRDTQRKRADRLHEALMTHRTFCHKHHGMAYEDMDPFPSPPKREA